jgi:hypothetical protein
MSESTTTTSNAHIGRARRAVHPFAVMAPLAVMIASLSATAAVLGDSNGDESYVVVKARRVITAGKEDFSPGVIVIEDGKISAVGKDIEYPPSAKVIDARELTVAPGFVHPRSRHGMADYKRGGVHGDQKASDEVFLSAMDFGDLLRAGYTTVCLVPDGEGIPGRASAYHTAGAEEQRLLSDSAYLHVHLRWEDNDKKALRDALKKAKEEIEKVEKA